MSEGERIGVPRNLALRTVSRLQALFSDETLEIRALITTDTDGIRDVLRSAAVCSPTLGRVDEFSTGYVFGIPWLNQA